MKIFVRILNGIIIIYLFILLILTTFYITQEKLYEKDFPNIYGYSYFHLDVDSMEPEISKNEFVIFQKTEDINVGDYVVYIDNNIKKIKKVISRNNYMLELNYLNNSEKTTIKIDDVFGKVVYQNKTLSKIMNVLTNYIVIIILIVIMFLLPIDTYRRYR